MGNRRAGIAPGGFTISIPFRDPSFPTRIVFRGVADARQAWQAQATLTARPDMTLQTRQTLRRPRSYNTTPPHCGHKIGAVAFNVSRIPYPRLKLGSRDLRAEAPGHGSKAGTSTSRLARSSRLWGGSSSLEHCPYYRNLQHHAQSCSEHRTAPGWPVPALPSDPLEAPRIIVFHGRNEATTHATNV